MFADIPFWISVAAGAVGILLTVISHVWFKIYALGRKLIYLILTLGCFLPIPVLNMIALKNLSIDQLYLWTAFVPVMTAFCGKVVFGEYVGRHHLMGLLFIVGGIYLYFAGQGAFAV